MQFKKAELPTDMSEWEKTRIYEDINSSEEHSDEFYRYGGWGIEKDSDGTFEVYAVVANEPIKVKGDMHSFEECITFIGGATASKKIEDTPAPKREPAKEEKGGSMQKSAHIPMPMFDNLPEIDEKPDYEVVGDRGANNISPTAGGNSALFSMTGNGREYSYGTPMSFKQMMRRR